MAQNKGSNDLNLLLKAKVVKLKAELDVKGSMPKIKQQVDEITKLLEKKPVKLKVELHATIKDLQAQLKKLSSNITESKSVKPLKIAVEIDVKGSATQIKRQLQEVHKIVDDFNKKYGKQIKQMQEQQQKASQIASGGAFNVPTNGKVTNFNNIKDYVNTLKEAKRILESKMPAGQSGLFNSFQIKDAQGNLKGFIATMEKANGVVEKVRYAWNKDKGAFQVVDRTTADNTEKMVHKSMQALQDLQRELQKTGKYSKELEKEYNSLMKSGANGKLNMDMVKAFQTNVKNKQAEIQYTKAENDLLREQQKLINEITRARKGTKGTFANDLTGLKNQLRSMSGNDFKDPMTKNFLADVRRQFTEIKNGYSDVIKKEKQLADAQSKRKDILGRLREIEKTTYAKSGTLGRANIEEVKQLAKNIRSMEDYIKVKKRMDEINRAKSQAKIDDRIATQLDKLKKSMYAYADATGRSTATIDARFAQLKNNMGKNLKQLENETTKWVRKAEEFARAQKEMNKANSYVTGANNTKIKSLVDSRDINGLKEYIGQLNGVRVATLKLATDNKGVSKITAQLESTGKVAKQLSYEITNVDKKLRHMGTADVFNRNANLGIFEQLRIAMARVPVWMTAMTAFYGSINVVKSMASEILKLDKALTDLKRVASDSINVDTIFRGAVSLSKELGNNIHDIMSAVVDLSRTFGQFNERQLLAISRTAVLMSNVSDLKVDEASQTLVGTMNAFNIEAEESIRIVDALNEVDNDYAISTQQLATGLQKSASTARTFGVTLEENIGNITAIGAVTMESGNIIGNSLKTIYSRITTLSKSQEVLQEVGVSLHEIGETGEKDVRPVNDILEDLSLRWFDLSKSQRQNIAVQVAGRYQLSRFLALMNNYEMAVEATNTATFSQGSAMRENAEYMKSFEARINQLKNGWTELSSAVGDAVLSDAMMEIIRLLTGMANIAVKVVNGFGALPVVLGVIGAIMLKMGVFTKLIGSITTGMTGMGVAFVSTASRSTAMGTAMARSTAVASAGFGMLGTRAVMAMTTVKTAMTRALVAVRTFSVGFQTILASTGIGLLFVGIGIAIEKLLSLYNEKKRKEEEMIKLNKKMVDSYRTHRDGMQSLVNKYEELNGKANLSVKEQNELVRTQKELAEQIPTTVAYIDSNGEAHLKNVKEIKKEIQAVEELSKANAELTQAKFLDSLEKQSKAYEKITEKISDLKKVSKTLKDNDGKSAIYATKDDEIDGGIFGFEIDNSKAIQQNKVEILMAEAEKTDAIQKTIKAVQKQTLAHFEATSQMSSLGDEQQAMIEKFISYNESMLRYAETPEEFEQAYRDLFNIGVQVGDVFAQAFDKMSEGIEDDPLALNELKKDLGEFANAIPKTFFELTDEFGKPKKTIEEVTEGLREIVNVSNRVAQNDGNWDGLVKRLQKAGLSADEAKKYLNNLAREHDNSALRAKAQTEGIENMTDSIEDLNEKAMEAIDLTSTLFGYSSGELAGIKSHIQNMHLLVDTYGEGAESMDAYKASQEAVTDFFGISNSELDKNASSMYASIEAIEKLDLSAYDMNTSWEEFINKNEELSKSEKELLIDWKNRGGRVDILTKQTVDLKDEQEELNKKVDESKIEDVFKVGENQALKEVNKVKEQVSDTGWMEKAKDDFLSMFETFDKAYATIDKWFFGLLPSNLLDDLGRVREGVVKILNVFDEGGTVDKAGKWFSGIKKSITDGWNGIWGDAKSWMNEEGSWQKGIADWFTSTVDWFKKLPEHTIPKLEEWYNGVRDWFVKLPTETIPNLQQWLTDTIDWFAGMPKRIAVKMGEWYVAVYDYFDTLPERTKEAWDTSSAEMLEWFTSMPSRITEKLVGWKDAVVSWFEGQHEENKRQYGAWGTSILQWFDDMPENITEKMSAWGSAISNFFTNSETTDNPFYKGFESWIKAIPALDTWDDGISSVFSGVWDTVIENVKKSFNSRMETLGATFNFFSALFKTDDESVNKNMDGFWESVLKWLNQKRKDFVKSFGEWWKSLGESDDSKDAGKKIVKKITDGAEDAKPDMLEKIASFLLDLPKYTLAVAGILILALGREIIKRIITGVTEELPALNKKFQELKDKAIKILVDLSIEGFNKGKEFVSKQIDGMQAKMKDWDDNWDDLKERAKKKITEMRDDIVSMARSLPEKMGKAIGDSVKGAESGIISLVNRISNTLENGFNGTVVAGVNKVLGYMEVPKDKRMPKINLPTYAKGTKNGTHKGGHAIVGEKGRELAYIPNQGIKMVGERGSEIVDLPKGTSVLPNKHTEELLKSYGFPAYEGGVGDFFTSLMDKPKDLMAKVFESMPFSNPFNGLVGGMISKSVDMAKDGAVDFIGKKLKDFFTFDIGTVFKGGGADMAKKAIMQALKITNQPMSWLEPLMTVAQKESGFNPNAINNWDINAKRGDPSVGLFQIINSTFQRWKINGMDNRRNPLHSAVAAIRYIIGRYGSIWGHPGIKSMSRGGGYKPYANGGFIDKPHMGLVGEDGEEVIIPLEEKRRKRGVDLWTRAGARLGLLPASVRGGQYTGSEGSFGASSGEGGESGGGDSGSSGIMQPSIYSGINNLDGSYQFNSLAIDRKDIAEGFKVDTLGRQEQANSAYISLLEARMNAMNKATVQYRDTLKTVLTFQNKNLSVQKQQLVATEKRQSYLLRELAKLPSLNKQSTAQREIYNKLMEEYDQNIPKIQQLQTSIVNATNEIKNKSIEIFTDFVDEIVTKYDTAVNKIKDRIDDTDFKIDVLNLTDPDNKEAMLNALGEKASLAQENQSTAKNKVDTLNAEYQKVGKQKGFSSKEAKIIEEQLKQAKEDYEDYTLAVLQAEKEIKDTRASIADESIQTLKDYHTKTKDMAIEAIDLEKEALQEAHDKEMKMYDEKADKINSFYDEKFKKMDEEKSQAEYQEQLDEKNARKAELLNKISLLSRDTSLEGKKKLAELQAELGTINEEIADFQKERQEELLRSSLEEQKQSQLDAIEAEKENKQVELDDKLATLDEQKEAINKQYEDLINNDKYWASMREKAIKGSFFMINQELARMNKELDEMNKGNFNSLYEGFSSLSEEVKKQIAEMSELDVDNMRFASKDVIDEAKSASKAKYVRITDGEPSANKGTKVATPAQTSPAKTTASKPKTTSKTPASKPATKTSTSQLDRQTTANLNMRSNAGFGNNVMQVIPKGAKVDYLSEEKGWVKIKYNGKTGYVSPKYLKKFDTGGYTGNNVPKGGALAVLHNKELVLNERQTSDILDATKVIEKVKVTLNTLKTNSLAKQFATSEVVINNNNNYNLNVNIERLNGDKQGADVVVKEIMKGLKKMGG